MLLAIIVPLSLTIARRNPHFAPVSSVHLVRGMNPGTPVSTTTLNLTFHFTRPYRAKQPRPVALSGQCGLQPEQQRRDQFGHGRMDRHGPTELIEGCLRVDGIEDAVDSLVATCTEN
jgi:hypothetical protein